MAAAAPQRVAAPSSSLMAATAPAPPAVEISTPRWLTGSLVLVGLLSIAFIVASIIAVREHRDALHIIANQSGPSVVAAERIATSLADMDANAANGLLNLQQRADSLKSYNEARRQMTSALVDAARNITLDEEDQEIKNLAENSSVYDARVEAAFTLQSTKAPALAVPQYLGAASLMDNSLIQVARKVDVLKRKELDDGYRRINEVSLVQRTFVWIIGLLLIVILLRIQFYLTERMRRTLNPLCLLATLVAGVLLLYTNHALSVASSHTKIAKESAFDSIHTLWLAKAMAYEADARESRYLLDHVNADAQEKAFREIAAQISNDPVQLLAVAKKSQSNPPTVSKGFLADELRNITFYGERVAAIKTVEAWTAYLNIDSRIRSLEQVGQHDKAVELSLGNGENQANWAFDRFISALDETIDINQTQFDKSASLGFEALKNFEIIGPIMALLAVLACFFGVLPRIREYSA